MGRPVLGTEALIKGMKREALPGFMAAHYTPANMVVTAAGNLEHDRVVELVARHFADLPHARPEAPMAAEYLGGEYREKRDLDQAHIVLGFDSPGYGEPDYYPAMLLSTLLGGGMSSRLFQEIREKTRAGLFDLQLYRPAPPMAGCSASTPAPASPRPPN